MKVLVCGGRNYADRDAFPEALDAIWRDAPYGTMMVIQGGATGADALARRWCFQMSVSYANVPADWNKHGKAAGPIRNQKMIDEYHPDICIAFPGGRGTADMVRRAKEAGINVVEAPAPIPQQQNTTQEKT